MEDLIRRAIEPRNDLLSRLKDYEDFLKSAEASAQTSGEKCAYIRSRMNLYKHVYELLGDKQAEEMRKYLQDKFASTEESIIMGED